MSTKILLALGLGLLAAALWRVSTALSSDALALGLGVFFGVLAGIPTALLVMASGRRPAQPEPEPEQRGRYVPAQPVALLPGPRAPQVIVIGEDDWSEIAEAPRARRGRQ